MFWAVHMKHRETGEKRIQKVEALTALKATPKTKIGRGTPWVWQGTEPFSNVEDVAVSIGDGYYKLNIEVKDATDNAHVAAV